MLPNEAVEALRVLALTPEEQIAFVPDHQDAPIFLAPDGESEISFPAEGILRASRTLLDNAFVDVPENVQDPLKEILCVIYMLLTLGEQIDYMWLLDKGRYQISGPLDDGWLVLRRLARLALQNADIAAASPKLDFVELMKLASFSAVTRPKQL